MFASFYIPQQSLGTSLTITAISAGLIGGGKSSWFERRRLAHGLSAAADDANANPSPGGSSLDLLTDPFASFFNLAGDCCSPYVCGGVAGIGIRIHA